MVMGGLSTLYYSMKEQGIDRCKFRYQVNHLTFDCLYLIDITPFELVMGCLGHNFALFFDVTRGFQIKPYIDDRETFFDLLNALRANGDSDYQLNIKEFLEEFNKHIPDTASATTPATSQDIVRYYSNIEDADKVYFCGWRNNSARGENVSEKNLRKTQLMMGQQAFEFAQRRNQSTMWTHEQNKSKGFYIPNH